MPLCLVCETRFYHQSHSSPAEPCDCGQEITRAHVREAGEDLALRVHGLRTVWLACDRSWPVVCKDCGSTMDVQDRRAGTEAEDPANPELLCANCRDWVNERAQEASDADYYGGGGSSETQRMVEAQKLK